jgi:acyl-CoA reductase-like NAD-dependent aldehyde dehydrogenase
MSKTREERAEALEKWADTVNASELKTAETQALRTIAQLVDQRNELDEQITEAVISARQSRRSWSEIGTMLGVSKQAAQRKYSPKASNRRA